MAKLVDPRTMPDSATFIPGLKPAVREFAPTDDADPSEVDEFIQLVRRIRDESTAAQTDRR